MAYARSGRRKEALQILEDVKSSAAISGIPGDLTFLHAELGNKDQAFEQLETAYQKRDIYLTTLKVNPFLDSLRSDPRFKQLLKKVGLEN